VIPPPFLRDDALIDFAHSIITCNGLL
jgi:hypothetical protein